MRVPNDYTILFSSNIHDGPYAIIVAQLIFILNFLTWMTFLKELDLIRLKNLQGIFPSMEPDSLWELSSVFFTCSINLTCVKSLQIDLTECNLRYEYTLCVTPSLIKGWTRAC